MRLRRTPSWTSRKSKGRSKKMCGCGECCCCRKRWRDEDGWICSRCDGENCCRATRFDVLLLWWLMEEKVWRWMRRPRMDSGREFDCISPKTLCRMLSICRCCCCCRYSYCCPCLSLRCLLSRSQFPCPLARSVLSCPVLSCRDDYALPDRRRRCLGCALEQTRGLMVFEFDGMMNLGIS